jgi:hypothetical protein
MWPPYPVVPRTIQLENGYHHANFLIIPLYTSLLEISCCRVSGYQFVDHVNNRNSLVVRLEGGNTNRE